MTIASTDRDVQVILSDRLKNAIAHLGGTSAFEEGLSLLLANFGLFRPENLGTEEEAAYRSFRLSSAGMQSLESLRRKVEARHAIPATSSTSVIARGAIELLVLRHQLKEFYKPEGWEARPQWLWQGGESPIATREEPAYATSARLPLVLWNQIQHLRDADRTHRQNLTYFAREAIDRANLKTLARYRVPVLSRDRQISTLGPVVSLHPYERQREVIQQARESLEATASEAIAAIFNQALVLGTVSWAPVKREDMIDQLYEAVCDAGLKAAAELIERPVEAVIEELVEAGYAERR